MPLNMNKKMGLWSVGLYLLLVTMYSLSAPFIEFMTILMILAFTGMFYSQKENIKEYKLLKIFIGTFLTFSVFSAIWTYFFTDLNYGLLKSILSNVPSVLFGTCFSLTFINIESKKNLNLSYLIFVSVGMFTGQLLFQELWLKFYILYWMGFECFIFFLYAFFGVKVPFLDKMYRLNRF